MYPDLQQAVIPPRHAELWDKLQSFDFDQEGSPGAFARRLARENNWDAPFAALAIGEYRKFLFLMKAGGRMVTPSLAVDEVWHLHLLYTRSYWVRLCAEIFAEPMHHDPGDGSEGDVEKFAPIFLRTLEDYREYFGTPPQAIWGPETASAQSWSWRNIPVNLGRWFRFCGRQVA